jgi:hypothetical protein
VAAEAATPYDERSLILNRQDAMTSEKVHGRIAASIVLIAIACGMGGCSLFGGEKIVAPAELRSPYPAEKLWAVAPIRNESGTSLIDSAALADSVTAQVQRIEGINIVPVNRVLEAMAAHDMPAINSVGDVLALIQTLEVDGLIVGTVSAWDPYDPPKIGMTIQLYSRRAPGGGAAVDSRSLTFAATDTRLPGTTRFNQPVNQASGYFDGANGDVLLRVQEYATGRTPYESAAGWRRYLMNMDLYAEFVSHELTRQLMQREWQRLTADPNAQLPNKQP